MNWTRVATGLSSLLSLVLVIRLVQLKLHNVYRIFALFLLFEVLSSGIAGVEKVLQKELGIHIDYRYTWLITRVIAWGLDLWMVYALLKAILTNLPGILSLSRRFLEFAVVLAVCIAIWSARSEYQAARAGISSGIQLSVTVGFILERCIATVALLILLTMLVFILSFPVKMPRNLAIFSVGFVFYFTVKTSLMLLRTFWVHVSFAQISVGVDFVLCGCFVYWLAFLNRQGETVPVTLGPRRHPASRPRLIGDLEAINAALLRSARR